jgi:hypothetical protein
MSVSSEGEDGSSRAREFHYYAAGDFLCFWIRLKQTSG